MTIEEFPPNYLFLSVPSSFLTSIQDKKVVLRAGLEPTTLCLEGRCSIQLSYRSTYYATGFFEGYAAPIPSHSRMSYTPSRSHIRSGRGHLASARTPSRSHIRSGRGRLASARVPARSHIRFGRRNTFFSELRRQIIQKAVCYNIPPPNEKSTRMSAKILKQTADRGREEIHPVRLLPAGSVARGAFLGKVIVFPGCFMKKSPGISPFLCSNSSKNNTGRVSGHADKFMNPTCRITRGRAKGIPSDRNPF